MSDVHDENRDQQDEEMKADDTPINEESDSEEEDEEEMFTYEQVHACVAAIRNNRVLSRFNLFDDTHKLHAILHDIENRKNQAKHFFSRIAEYGTCHEHDQSDEVLKGLQEILAELNSESSSLRNIDPLGKHTSTNDLPISRHDLELAIELRDFLVNVDHVNAVRERQASIEQLHSQIDRDEITDPKDIPSLASHSDLIERLKSASESVLKMHEYIEGHADMINRFEKDLFENPKEQISDLDLTACLDSLHAALEELASCKVISLVEEKIAARLDALMWYKEADQLLSQIRSTGDDRMVNFDQMKVLYQSLQAVLGGKSATRTRLTEQTVRNDKVETEIRISVLDDVTAFFDTTASEVRSMFEHASSWKERADSIITSLKMYCNPNVGDSISAQKLPAMVDSKRIHDLIDEYKNMTLSIPGYIEMLQKVKEESDTWSQGLRTKLLDENVSFTELLSFVEIERDRRPRGIIMNPTRNAVDTLVDLLTWYGKVKSVATSMLDELNSSQESASVFSSLIIENLYPLLVDGSEILEMYCVAYTTMRGVTGQFKAQAEKSLEILDTAFNLRKTSKIISREKIESNELIGLLLSRMFSKDSDEGFFPFQLMLWFHWHLFVADFVSPWDGIDRTGLPQRRVPTLADAKDLRSKQPFIADAIGLDDAPIVRTLIHTKSQELLCLDKLIEQGDVLESAIKLSFSKARDLLRGSIQKADIVRDHLSQLKEHLATVKARSAGKGGLPVNGSLEGQLDHHIKIFSWLVRTFPYPLLHQGEPSFSSESDPESTTTRIPWDILVTLYNSIPNDVDGSGDFALCTLRVKEMFAAAKKWQDEITKNTMISNRGNKRRSQSATAETNDTENAAKLQMAKMEMLAKDPILSKVDMPREKAVNAMIHNSTQFEIELAKFLAQDFEGSNQDKAPFPKGHSLVGNNGQFILYRLTCSPLFGMMQSSMNSLSQIGDNVFAETPGKAAFDWMRSAVTWIERLHEAVTQESNFTHTNEKLLVIPAKDAIVLRSIGEDIFLQTTEDMRQTLSNHGIYVSTSIQKKRLKVTLKKDGSHHSVGGTVLR